MKISTILRTTTASLVAACTFSTAALTQEPTAPNQRADALFERAETMGIQSSRFSRDTRRAADLYMKSAALRPTSDSRKIESVRRAGGLLVSVDPQKSYKLYEYAAQIALVNMDFFSAASFYADAAWVATNHSSGTLENLRAAKASLEMASRLIEMPSVTTEQRESLLRRIEIAPVIFTRNLSSSLRRRRITFTEQSPLSWAG